MLKAGFAGCQHLITSEWWLYALEGCQLLVTSILGNPLAPSFNVYDYTKKCDNPPLCYDFSATDKFLNLDKVRAALGVSGREWVNCNMEVHTALLGDWVTNMASKVSAILEKGLEVLVYSGDRDFICNWRGGEAWTAAVEWSGQAAFNANAYKDWAVNGKAAGQLKGHNNFKFLRVYEAGHMVPMDQP